MSDDKRELLPLPFPVRLSISNRDMAVQWSDGRRDYPDAGCVHELFEAQARSAPDAIAVVFGARQLTYRELNHLADGVAHRLRRLGVGPDALVGLYLERSPEMLVGILGILKAGAAYVPLDCKAPADWLQFALNDTRIAVLLTVSKLLDRLAESGAQAICLDSLPADFTAGTDDPASAATADHLAYVIYTSGSTGTPKGVEIPHRALTNFTIHAGRFFALAPGDRVLQFASISFDTAVEEIFPCLTRGATLVLRAEDMLEAVPVFMARCRELAITVLDLPTAYWHEVVASLESHSLAMPDKLRLVIIGGERAIPERVASWQRCVSRSVRLVNSYGPTETTVVATMCDLTDFTTAENAAPEVPIGTPIANVQVHVLDPSMKPVPVGVPGELYIGGVGVACGYLNRPELTSEKFVANPFDSDRQSRLFRTGDLVRSAPDGNLYFLGRLDRQVKVRGFRVELDGIEAVLRKHPLVKDAAVLQEPSQKRLFAYVVGADAAVLRAEELKSFAARKLPEYMVPSAFAVLDAFPMNRSGKIDRRALAALEIERTPSEHSFVAPVTSIERRLAAIWEEMLSVKPVGIRDSFFDLGGDSLLGVRLMSQIEKRFGKGLPLVVLYEAPTVELLSKVIAEEGSEMRQWSSLVPLQPHGSRPPFFWIHGETSDAFLPRYLDPDQPVYGLRHQSDDGRPARYTTVEEIARYYLTQIRSARRRGPYVLGGYCFGGLVALEIAQQLRKQRESVPLLVLLAPDEPVNVQGDADGIHDRAISGRAASSWRAGLRRRLDNFKKLETSKKARYVIAGLAGAIKGNIVDPIWYPIRRHAKKSACRVILGLGYPLPVWLRSFYILDVYGQAVERYVPEAYCGRVVLFNPINDDVAVAPWRKLIGAHLKTQYVSGNHTEVVRSQEHLKTWALALMRLLEEVPTDDAESHRYENVEPVPANNGSQRVIGTASLLGIERLGDLLSDTEVLCANIPMSAWDVCTQLL